MYNQVSIVISNQVILPMGEIWGKDGGVFLRKVVKKIINAKDYELFLWNLLALWKSELPQHFHDAHYANLSSTILSLKSFKMEGKGGEISTNWIICARV